MCRVTTVRPRAPTRDSRIPAQTRAGMLLLRERPPPHVRWTVCRVTTVRPRAPTRDSRIPAQTRAGPLLLRERCYLHHFVGRGDARGDLRRARDPQRLHAVLVGLVANLGIIGVV